jgi:hypothetical protein
VACARRGAAHGGRERGKPGGLRRAAQAGDGKGARVGVLQARPLPGGGEGNQYL